MSPSSLIRAPLVGGAVEIRGAVRVEPTARGVIPRRVTEEGMRRIPDDFMRGSVGQSAGIRLAFRTAARHIVLHVSGMKMAETATFPLPDAWYELCSGTELIARASSSVGPRMLFSFERPERGIVPGPDDRLVFDVDGVERDYELWLPYTDEVELLGLAADLPLAPPAARSPLRWLHHGSSISHGYIASTTTRTWPVRVAQAVGVDLTNLAYSGNALLDQLTARTIRDTPAHVISVKLGINIVNGDMMRQRIFRSAVHGFLDTIRDGHPETPLLVVSPIHCGPVEHAPGPTIPTPGRDPLWITTAGRPEELAAGKLSLGVIRQELAAIVELRRAEDPAIAYLDGLSLYGAADDAVMPMPDNLHPGDDVNALIADRFAAAAFGDGGWFAAARPGGRTIG